MQRKQKKGNKKAGRWGKSPSNQLYKVTKRWLSNKRRRILAHQRRIKKHTNKLLARRQRAWAEAA